MTKDEKQRALARMPADYMPNEAMPYMPLYFENERNFRRLSDEQAGKLIKRLYEYARDYAASYDKSLEPNCDGLDDGAAMLMDIMCGKVQGVYDNRRATSYLRSKDNNGGRPEKT